MDGGEVRERHGAQHLVVGHPQVAGVLDYRQRARDALVAAPAVDDHRHGAAAHACVRACRRGRPRTAGDVIRPCEQERLPNARTPVARESLVRDGAVELHLALDHLADVLDVDLVRKLPDSFEGEGREARLLRLAVGFAGVLLARRDPIHANGRPIARKLDHVGVPAGHARHAGMTLGCGNRAHVEVRHALGERDRAEPCRDKLPRAPAVLLAYALKHLKRPRGVPANGTKRSRGLNAALVARVGHRHALYVLDYIAAARDLEVLRHGTQCVTGEGSNVGHGDGLGAAQGADKLTPQDVQIGVVGAAVHGPSSRRCARLRARLEETVALEGADVTLVGLLAVKPPDDVGQLAGKP